MNRILSSRRPRVTVSLPSDPAAIDQHVAGVLRRKVEMSDTAERLISERESTHGDYPTMAAVQIALVQAMEASPNWSRLHAGVKVGLMSTAMKMARILTGDWRTADHYDDIGGYIRLAGKVAEVCRAEEATRIATDAALADEKRRHAEAIAVRDAEIKRQLDASRGRISAFDSLAMPTPPSFLTGVAGPVGSSISASVDRTLRPGPSLQDR